MAASAAASASAGVIIVARIAARLAQRGGICGIVGGLFVKNICNQRCCIGSLGGGLVAGGGA